ncbi:MAG: hypothetical protein ABUK01_05895 [Leptospirales bacterium]
MAYTPEFSMKASSTLRRIAWAVGKPMTKTAEDIMDFLPQVIDKKLVCKRCRDKSKCKDCVFFGRVDRKNAVLIKSIIKD